MNTPQCWFSGLWPKNDLVVEKKNDLDTHQRARPKGQRGLGNSYIFGLLHSFVNFVSGLVPFITIFHAVTSRFLLNYNLTIDNTENVLPGSLWFWPMTSFSTEEITFFICCTFYMYILIYLEFILLEI